MDDFSPDTWVSRNHLVDQSKSEQYVASIYWAFQTFVSLGYGDIVAHTDVEFIISILWILVNVGFYSFSLSNLTSTLSNIDVRSRYLVVVIWSEDILIICLAKKCSVSIFCKKDKTSRIFETTCSTIF